MSKNEGGTITKLPNYRFNCGNCGIQNVVGYRDGILTLEDAKKYMRARGWKNLVGTTKWTCTRCVDSRDRDRTFNSIHRNKPVHFRHPHLTKGGDQADNACGVGEEIICSDDPDDVSCDRCQQTTAFQKAQSSREAMPSP